MKVNDKYSEFFIKNQWDDNEYEGKTFNKFVLDKDI